MKGNITITVIEYGMGNISSIRSALNLVADNVKIAAHGNELESPEAIVVPGVGSFAEGMENLRDRCFIEPLSELVVNQETPYLGICLGLQFLADYSQEGGKHEGFGWIQGTVKRLKPADEFSVPHMGWNSTKIEPIKNTVLFHDLENNGTFYYLHSYHLDPTTIEHSIVTARSWHGANVIGAIRKNNIFAVQFHPEKSQDTGLKLLENFTIFADRGGSSW